MSKKLLLSLFIIPIFLVGCTDSQDVARDKTIDNNKDSSSSNSVAANKAANRDEFLGDKGEKVESQEGKIMIPETDVSDGDMHSFNYFSETKNKTLYFFVVQASDGTYRVAANACEVCYGAKKGFRQVGDLIKCDNCGVTYSKDRIALEKGGCNPGPINADAVIEEGNLIINVQDAEAIAYLF